MPTKSGEPPINACNNFPESVALRSGNCSLSMRGRSYIRKYQLKFVTVYIRQMNNKFRDRNSVPQGTPVCPECSERPAWMSDCSASFVDECSSGRLRNQ